MLREGSNKTVGAKIIVKRGGKGAITFLQYKKMFESGGGRGVESQAKREGESM